MSAEQSASLPHRVMPPQGSCEAITGAVHAAVLAGVSLLGLARLAGVRAAWALMLAGGGGGGVMKRDERFVAGGEAGTRSVREGGERARLVREPGGGGTARLGLTTGGLRLLVVPFLMVEAGGGVLRDGARQVVYSRVQLLSRSSRQPAFVTRAVTAVLLAAGARPSQVVVLLLPSASMRVSTKLPLPMTHIEAMTVRCAAGVDAEDVCRALLPAMLRTDTVPLTLSCREAEPSWEESCAVGLARLTPMHARELLGPLTSCLVALLPALLLLLHTTAPPESITTSCPSSLSVLL